MKLRKLAISIMSVALLGGCSKGEMYVPDVGGVIDTLHNEVHVASYADLIDPAKTKPEVAKIYINDEDGWRYIYNPMTGEYELIEKTDTIINFFFDSEQTTKFVDDPNDKNKFQKQVECPIYVAEWFKTKPLGECPSEIDGKDELGNYYEQEIIDIGAVYGFKPKENTHFVGWSMYPSCLGDESHMWKFDKDYKQQPTTNLYGIWVEE